MNRINKFRLKLLATCLLSACSILATASNVAEVDLSKPVMKTSGLNITPEKQALMTKLAKLSFFKANFIQKILNESGDLLQQGAGKLAISKPNLIHWQTTEPDETFIISNGETLWFYDPFIEQATAYNLAQSINNTPILLLTSNDEKLWQQYQVKQSADLFIITPLSKNSQIKSLTIRFSTQKAIVNQEPEQLSEFSFVDATGQISQIILSDFDVVNIPDALLFDFTLPQGVRLEDKR